VTEGVLLYILKFEMALAARLIASKIILKKKRHLKSKIITNPYVGNGMEINFVPNYL
jgi:hypothetical protein